MSVAKELRSVAEKAAARIDALEVDLRDVEEQLEHYERAAADDEGLKRRIHLLEEFIADVRRGIRDLDEYDAVAA